MRNEEADVGGSAAVLYGIIPPINNSCGRDAPRDSVRRGDGDESPRRGLRVPQSEREVPS